MHEWNANYFFPRVSAFGDKRSNKNKWQWSRLMAFWFCEILCLMEKVLYFFWVYFFFQPVFPLCNIFLQIMSHPFFFEVILSNHFLFLLSFQFLFHPHLLQNFPLQNTRFFRIGIMFLHLLYLLMVCPFLAPPNFPSNAFLNSKFGKR